MNYKSSFLSYAFSYGVFFGSIFVAGFSACELTNKQNVPKVLFDQNGQPIENDQHSIAAWRLLSWQIAEDREYAAVASINGCTAALLAIDGSQDAYLLTAGHCFHPFLDMDADEVILHQQVTESDRSNFFFARFFEYEDVKDCILAAGAGKCSGVTTEKFPVKEIVYASMKGRDLALFKLDARLDQLQMKNLKPFQLCLEPLQRGTALDLVGIARIKPAKMRLSSCEAGDMVSLKEGPYTWSRAIRHHCSSAKGSSGGPMFSKDTTGQLCVAAVNTTGSEFPGNKPNCEIDQPCEKGIFRYKTEEYTFVNYAFPVDFLRHCFTGTGVFEPTLSSCTLEKTSIH